LLKEATQLRQSAVELIVPQDAKQDPGGGRPTELKELCPADPDSSRANPAMRTGPGRDGSRGFRG